MSSQAAVGTTTDDEIRNRAKDMLDKTGLSPNEKLKIMEGVEEMINEKKKP